ncbi:MAG: hypothetical protein KIT68_04570 [Phycisphaeraceae bacterium]|nr:hypothetical protein [Phycisphaeraceae bacterium]
MNVVVERVVARAVGGGARGVVGACCGTGAAGGGLGVAGESDVEGAFAQVDEGAETNWRQEVEIAEGFVAGGLAAEIGLGDAFEVAVVEGVGEGGGRGVLSAEC